ncbi:metal-dependent transcriptional regulator [Corynebacterium sp. HS2168-gen11]|uniref:metal-dependent transcriptional regulator n=1 Tax=Corynebacterium sp. HS2168-gen11 TaxID=2974027 RepID=UPI00216B47B2|nr:metal-dependent transcriptional regulator [Corynebacterium sp. HS2168-gen11]MCS4535996.1 metal-dependent transcriptional regulator [Corynebacterium sp. HS2168-gen11]
MDFPERTQDYLKIIWDIHERTHQPASLGAIASALGQKASTTSEAMKRLHAQGLVDHQKYTGVTLTPAGQRIALAMVRRHRLIELFLVEVMGYQWFEVHEEADLLEHAVSDTFLARIEKMLDYPIRDPHGDPIPDPDGNVATLSTIALSDLCVGETVVVEQINDADPKFLHYLHEHGVWPGVEIVFQAQPRAGMLLFSIQETELMLTTAAAADIRVRRDASHTAQA